MIIMSIKMRVDSSFFFILMETPNSIKLLYPIKYLFDKKTGDRFQLVQVSYQQKEVIRAQSLSDPNRIEYVKRENKKGTIYYSLRLTRQIDKRTGSGVKRIRPKDADGHLIYNRPSRKLSDEQKATNKQLRHIKKQLSRETQKRKAAEQEKDAMSLEQQQMEPTESGGNSTGGKRKKKRSPGARIVMSPNGTTVTLVASVNISDPQSLPADDAGES